MTKCDGQHDPTCCEGCALIRMERAETEVKRLKAEVASRDAYNGKLEAEQFVNARLRAEVERKDAKLQRLCQRYCDWYMSGRASDAGDVAYELVTMAREALAPAAPTANPAESGSKVADGEEQT